MFPLESRFVLTDPRASAYDTRTDGGINTEIAPQHDKAAPSPECPADRELTDPHRKLTTLPAIEQAKGMLMGYYGISADVAFEVLRRWSMRHNVQLDSLCATLVAEGSHAADFPSACLRQALDRWQPTNNEPVSRRIRQGPRGLRAVPSSSPAPGSDPAASDPKRRISADSRRGTWTAEEVP